MGNETALEKHANHTGKEAIKIECFICDTRWEDRDDFLRDHQIKLVGYQVNFVNLAYGLFLFNHSCNTTLSLPVAAFKDLYKGPIFKERATGSEECPGYCLHHDEQRRCSAHCECAYVREIIQIINDWPKNL